MLKTDVMFETAKMNDLILDDELVNDFEFAERLYQNGLTEEMTNYYSEQNLIWADMV